MARVALGVTGSVAAIKTPELARLLHGTGHDVRVVATEPALYFFDAAELPVPKETAPAPIGASALFRAADEWPRLQNPPGLYQREDPVLHIELRRWADLLVVAPLDANTLAKLAYGLSDNLLTCLYRAWDPARPILLAPAMNTYMWGSPLTAQHLQLLLETHASGPAPPGARSPEELIEAINHFCPQLRICPPQSKRLACGDDGMGAMADVAAILEAVNAAL